MRERLKSKPSPVWAKYVALPRLTGDAVRSFDNMAKINLAHVLMLKKERIISDEDAKILLNAVLDLLKKGPDVIPLDPNYEDYYFNTERYLITQVGPEVGGRLHTARSRNDLHSTLLRMNVRDEYFKELPRFFALREMLLKKAIENRDTVMTGYTHMQPAQPMTMGFYFAGIAQAMERDFDRISAVFKHLNYSTLGACAFAGTGFPIDRQYTAELLGFYGPVLNTIDAVATRDYIMEIMAAFAMCASTLGRFAHDLYYWATDEFAYIELDDAMSSVSSIMPQKKNPSVLEYIKSKCAHQMAAFSDAFCAMRGTPYTHVRDVGGESIHLIWDSFAEMEAMLELLREALKDMKIKKEHMKDRADSNYCTVTELADAMVKREKFSFRTAHEIVGHVVMECVDAGLNARAITAEKLDAASVQFAGRPLGWSNEEVQAVLDSLESVKNRVCAGSPKPENVDAMVSAMTKRLAEDRAVFDGYVSYVEEAYKRLDHDVQENVQ